MAGFGEMTAFRACIAIAGTVGRSRVQLEALLHSLYSMPLINSERDATSLRITAWRIIICDGEGGHTVTCLLLRGAY